MGVVQDEGGVGKAALPLGGDASGPVEQADFLEGVGVAFAVGQGAQVVAEGVPVVHRGGDGASQRRRPGVVLVGDFRGGGGLPDDADLVLFPLVLGVVLAGLDAPAVDADDQQGRPLRPGALRPERGPGLRGTEEGIGRLSAAGLKGVADALGDQLDLFGTDRHGGQTAQQPGGGREGPRQVGLGHETQEAGRRPPAGDRQPMVQRGKKTPRTAGTSRGGVGNGRFRPPSEGCGGSAFSPTGPGPRIRGRPVRKHGPGVRRRAGLGESEAPSAVRRRRFALRCRRSAPPSRPVPRSRRTAARPSGGTLHGDCPRLCPDASGDPFRRDFRPVNNWRLTSAACSISAIRRR